MLVFISYENYELWPLDFLKITIFELGVHTEQKVFIWQFHLISAYLPLLTFSFLSYGNEKFKQNLIAVI